MAKGASKGNKRDNSIRIINGTLLYVNNNGDLIDLHDYPLKYGEKDAALSGAARATIEDFERRYYNNDIEHSILIDSYGNVVERNIGTHDSVGATRAARRKAAILSHNHPREDGVLGGTFSSEDIRNFKNYNQSTFRATTKEGTYSITKKLGFRGNDLLKNLKKFERESYKAGDKKSRLLGRQHKKWILRSVI